MKRINVAIASPGDVVRERDVVQTVFTRWNDKSVTAMLHPLDWRYSAVPTMGDHPQHILNQQIIEKSDLLIAILWSRLGTPTPTARSGTVEEIREFIRTKGPKRVMLYFCTRDLPNDIDLSEVAKLREFENEMKPQGLYHKYATTDQFERDLYQHLDAKVDDFLRGKLPLPEPPTNVASNAAASGKPAGPKPHPDHRLRDPIDFGSSLDEISGGFKRRMDEFDAIDGGGRDKYLHLAAHVYRSVALCLDRFLTFSAVGFAEQDRAALERLSIRLKRLATSSSEYLSRPFPQYWKDGREVCDDLLAHVRFLVQTGRR